MGCLYRTVRIQNGQYVEGNVVIVCRTKTQAVRNGRKSAYPRICRSSPLFAYVGTQAGEYRIRRRQDIYFRFRPCGIFIEENELLDSYLQVTVRNMDVTVCAGNLSQKFTVSDEICIAMRDVGKFYNLADKFMKYICIRLKSNPFKYLEPKSEGWNVAESCGCSFCFGPWITC